jgi:hypothetical protein
MEIVNIKYTDDVSGDLEKMIDDHLCKYAEENSVALNYKKFMFSAIDENEEKIGRLFGYTFYEEIFIHDILSDKFMTNADVCRKLVQNVENHFSGKGYNDISVSTTACNAKEFYLSCGFELEFIRKNKQNPKFDNYFFIKKF